MKRTILFKVPLIVLILGLDKDDVKKNDLVLTGIVSTDG